MFLYRGAKFSEDSITRQKNHYEFGGEETPVSLPNGLFYGLSLYSGALYDGGATAYCYMRQALDAQVLPVRLEEFTQGSTPFYARLVHLVISLGSRGEIFHGRTKFWNMAPDSKVLGYFGISTCDFSQLKEFCRTTQSQQEVETSFSAYKKQAYILAAASQS